MFYILDFSIALTSQLWNIFLRQGPLLNTVLAHKVLFLKIKNKLKDMACKRFYHLPLARFHSCHTKRALIISYTVDYMLRTTLVNPATFITVLFRTCWVICSRPTQLIDNEHSGQHLVGQLICWHTVYRPCMYIV